MEVISAFDAYIKAIDKNLSLGNAAEQTYRAACGSSLLPKFIAALSKSRRIMQEIDERILRWPLGRQAIRATGSG